MQKVKAPPLPLIEAVSSPISAEEVFENIKLQPYGFFLDSALDVNGLGRFSYLSCQPFLLLTSRGKEISLSGYKSGFFKSDPFSALKELLECYQLSTDNLPVPFIGGAVGYFSYDLGRLLEKLPQKARDDLKLPELFLGFYDTIIAFDHYEGIVYIISSGLPWKTESYALSRLRLFKQFLKPSPKKLSEEDFTGRSAGSFSGNFSKEDYLRAVERAREYIIAGDIFQINLSQRFSAKLLIPPDKLYLKLRRLSPTPFAAYLNFGSLVVASASPELFLKLKGSQVETRPMKGTRPRGGNSEEDKALAQELLLSPKEQAENVMIVDLERNDLGKVCDFGSVKVRELFTLEKYSTVFQLTSTVEGKLREGNGTVELIKACFPGGSITGAPKVRAMEIIEELEPTRRSLYTGALGWLSFTGDLELSIVIRTFVIKGKIAYFQVGGAVVYDSEPEKEYQETLDKARALFSALGL